jgi:P-type Cu2+ transporter
MTTIAATTPAAALTADRTCFHCGEAVPEHVDFRAAIEGVQRQMCCAGCKAVAEAIAGAGLCAYYDRRSTPGKPGATSAVPADSTLGVLDSPAYQQGVVQIRPDGTREVSLLLEGVTCAACIWLIERRLQSLPGVREASVNFSTQRAYVHWDDEAIRLSGIVEAVQAIGYGAEPFDPRRSEARRRGESRTALWRLFVAAFGMMQVMMYALPAYIADGDMSADIEALMRWASLLLTLPVIGFSSAPFFAGAWRDLRARTAGMDVPVALGIGVAFVASVYATVAGHGHVYFDSITMFVFLLLAARYLENVVRMRAGEAMDRLGRLLPAFASRLKATLQGDVVQRVAVAELIPGDRVVVSAGDVVPADGVVDAGESEVDEALISGESRGVSKRPGAALIGGSMNMASRLIMRVDRVGADTVVAGIGRLLDRASAEKPRIAQLADRIASRFVAAILLIATAAGVAWWYIDPARALPIAVTVLVITCPCALSLATPAALAAATGSLTKLGVLVAHGHALETLARATHFVFDKTGTVTIGDLSLVGIMPLGAMDRRGCLALAAALEADSRHPLAKALTEAATREPLDAVRGLRDVRDVAGDGVEALLRGRRMRIGRPAFVAELAGAVPTQLAYVADHVQVIALGDEQGWIALFTLSDTLRPEARTLVRALRAEGRSVWLLTGDRASVAAHTARELGIDGVKAEARPEDKLAFVRELQDAGAVVAMVGDGVNDAPVLAQAQVSVAMGSGADIAQTSADVVLASNSLGRLQDAIQVARKAERIIGQNLAWASVYNVIAVPAAVLGWVSPLIASVGMAASSAIVVANAVRAAHPALWRRGPGAHSPAKAGAQVTTPSMRPI